MNEVKCSQQAIKQILRWFLSPGGVLVTDPRFLTPISPALRLGCQAAKAFFLWNWQTKWFFIVCQYCLLLREIEIKSVTTRWPSTQVAANWSGGRWREDSFLHQGLDWEPPWSAMSSSPWLVAMTMTTTSPRSSPGTQSPSPGNQVETLLWRGSPMQPSQFQLRLSLVADLRSIWKQ